MLRDGYLGNRCVSADGGESDADHHHAGHLRTQRGGGRVGVLGLFSVARWGRAGPLTAAAFLPKWRTSPGRRSSGCHQLRALTSAGCTTHIRAPRVSARSLSSNQDSAQPKPCLFVFWLAQCARRKIKNKIKEIKFRFYFYPTNFAPQIKRGKQRAMNLSTLRHQQGLCATERATQEPKQEAGKWEPLIWNQRR